jgi:hypothetical protein
MIQLILVAYHKHKVQLPYKLGHIIPCLDNLTACLKLHVADQGNLIFHSYITSSFMINL